MAGLWLKCKDENGAGRRVAVEANEFVIGRHSSSDLSIRNGKLSREHLKIERFGDVFVAHDVGSSNGTNLNGEPLDQPAALKNGDKLDLGGGLEIEIELEDGTGNAGAGQQPEAVREPPKAAVGAAPVVAAGVSQPSAGGGFPTGILILAPVLGIILIAIIGGGIYLFSGNSSNAQDSNDIAYVDDDNDTPVKTDRSPEPSPADSPGLPVNASTPGPGGPTPDSDPKDGGGLINTEKNAAAFMRKIAQNDAKAFLTSEQAKVVDNRIKSLSSSSAVAENIRSANRNAAGIRSLAASKNLKPEFLAVAAIAKLDGSRGDVLKTAAGMADTLDKLRTQIGNELGEDAVLMIAAYQQGQNGDLLKMRNMLQQLSNQYPDSTRVIRTIWFLREKGKITEAEFEFALRFLAIGTISQNPADFNVNSEALKL